MRISPRAALAGSCALVLLSGCRTATQITVETTTDMKCADHGGTTLTTGPLTTGPLSNGTPDAIDARPASAVSLSCDDTTHRIGSVVVVPSGDNDAEVVIRIVSGVGIDPEKCAKHGADPSCIVATRSLHFIPHEALKVNVAMRLDCRGVACGSTETCVHGACVSAAITDSTVCSGSAGCSDDALGSVDGGADGGASDAASDATIDTGARDAEGDVTDGDLDGGVDAQVDAGPNDVLDMSLGSSFSCALMGDRTVKCWGSNNVGQIGQADLTHDYPTPTTIPGLHDVQQLRAKSIGHACALLGDQTVSCWGGNANTELGRGSNVYDDPTPGKVIGVANVGQLVTGERHSCALRADGNAVWCWGQFGDTGHQVDPPALVSGLPALAEIAVGSEWSAGRTAAGAVWTWGVNYYGQLGIGSDDGGIENDVPHAISLAAVTQIALGDNHGCGLFANGTASCWGDNRVQQLGRDTSGADIPSPLVVPNLANAKRLEMGSLHSCALLGDTTLACWGSNEFGQNGAPVIHDAKTDPTVVASIGSGVRDVWAGFDTTCARKSDGAIVCWGQNDHAQLGDGTTTPGPTPRAIRW